MKERGDRARKYKYIQTDQHLTTENLLPRVRQQGLLKLSRRGDCFISGGMPPRGVENTHYVKKGTFVNWGGGSPAPYRKEKLLLQGSRATMTRTIQRRKGAFSCGKETDPETAKKERQLLLGKEKTVCQIWNEGGKKRVWESKPILAFREGGEAHRLQEKRKNRGMRLHRKEKREASSQRKKKSENHMECGERGSVRTFG